MELNAEQIKKALECCASEEYICTQCPIDEKIKDDCECGKVVARNALALITSQEQRIKELTADLEAVRSRADETIDALHGEIRELTSENEAWQQRLISEEEKSSKAYYDLACEVENLRAENERLMKALNTDISVVRVVSRGSGKTAHLHEVMRIKADAIRADTVREMQTAIKKYYSQPKYLPTPRHPIRHTAIDLLFAVIDQIAKEKLEGSNDT